MVTLLGIVTTGRVGMEDPEVAVVFMGTVMLPGRVVFKGPGMDVGVGTPTKLEVDIVELVVRLKAAVDEGSTKFEVLLETLLGTLLLTIEELCAVLVLLGIRNRSDYLRKYAWVEGKIIPRRDIRRGAGSGQIGCCTADNDNRARRRG